MLTRRELFLSTSGIVAAACAQPRLRADARPVVLAQPTPEAASEDQRGDPDSPSETIEYDAGDIRRLNTRQAGRAFFEKWVPDLPQKLVSKALEFEGINRQNSPARIAQFLNLFGIAMRNPAGKFEAFCAAGISYCAIAAYASDVRGAIDPKELTTNYRSLAADVDNYYFYPTVSCQDMWNIAKGRHSWVASNPKAPDPPKPGWVVLFDWDNKGRPNHCGLVMRADGNKVYTIEFNTSSSDNRNGGAVATRERDYTHIVGFIRTDKKP